MAQGGESSCGKREVDTKRSGYCLPNKDDFDELVIVTGNTQNSPAPKVDFTKGDLYEILAGVFYSAERGKLPKISLISAASDNRAISYKAKFRVAKNVLASNNELKKLAQELNTAVLKAPSSAGADYVGAILEAQNLISSAAKNPLIVVIGSGYNDDGVLNFASGEIFNQYWRDPQVISTILNQHRRTRTPVLTDISLIWYNLGEVVSPQPNMNKYKRDLQEIYQLALEHLGAKKAELSNYTGIAAEAQAVKSDFSVQPVFVDELKVGDIFNVNESIGRFYPDRSDLINQSEVEQKLASFARRFNHQAPTRLKVTGYVAYCVDNGELSLARANTIKGVLTKLNIPDNKIITHGEKGSPPESAGESSTCNSKLPETERRTVKIEVVKE